MRTSALRRALVDGRAAARATGVRALATTDETRATAAKRELAVLAEAFQRYDGRARSVRGLRTQFQELRDYASRVPEEAKKQKLPQHRRRERRLRSL